MSVSPFGYQDYQRASQWGSGVAVFSLTGAQNGVVSTGALNMSGYGSLYIFGSVADNNVTFTATWYLDQALTVPCGVRHSKVLQNVVNAQQATWPQFGPWCQVVFTPPAGVPVWTPTIRMLASNRTPGSPFMPTNSSLIDSSGSLLAGASVTLYPSDFYAGPIQWLTIGGSQGVTIEHLSYSDAANAYNTVYFYSVAANAADQEVFYVAGGGWGVTITNQSGVATCNGWSFTAVASLAGTV